VTGSGASRATLAAAVVANVLGWVLPALYEDRGWEAFVFALSPLWDYRSFQSEPFALVAFIVTSALTNVLFAALAAVLVLGAPRRARVVLWAAAAATLLNLYWPILLESDRAHRASGYFIWVSSFALLALSAFLALRSAPR
jgi:hypothetical protein